MIKNMKPVIKAIKVPGTIFATATTSDHVELTNYQGVTFLLGLGEGDPGNITLTVKAKSADTETSIAVPFLFMAKDDSDFSLVDAVGKEITIGGEAGESNFFLVRISDAMLASVGCDRVMLHTTSAESSTVLGAIYAILDNPRYSE
jgi:hypothetical protein